MTRNLRTYSPQIPDMKFPARVIEFCTILAISTDQIAALVAIADSTANSRVNRDSALGPRRHRRHSQSRQVIGGRQIPLRGNDIAGLTA